MFQYVVVVPRVVHVVFHAFHLSLLGVLVAADAVAVVFWVLPHCPPIYLAAVEVGAVPLAFALQLWADSLVAVVGLLAFARQFSVGLPAVAVVLLQMLQKALPIDSPAEAEVAVLSASVQQSLADLLVVEVVMLF